MLEPEDDYFYDAVTIPAPTSSYGGGVDGPGLTQLAAAAEAPAVRGSQFPLVLKPLGLSVNGTQPSSPHDHAGGQWSYHRQQHQKKGNGREQDADCGNHCPSPHNGRHPQDQHSQHHLYPGSPGQAHSERQGGGAGGSNPSNGSSSGASNSNPSSGGQEAEQHLLAVGSRQWGSGGWWDGRGLLRVKIYDFAIYANPHTALHAMSTAAGGSGGGGGGPLPLLDAAAPATGCPGGSCPGAGGGGCDGAASRLTELVKRPGCGVDMSLTIRACRNLPLPLLSQEFERVLQRRTEKAGGRADDPALAELLSYFSVERLPAHVVVSQSAAAAASAPAAVASPCPGEDAVRKGAAITFSRSAGGELVTEAGGRVLGRVFSPALAEALFDLYLGDQPVSKKAKAAAGATLLRMAEGGGAEGGDGAVHYRLQPGERLLCGGAGTPPSACILELP